MYNFQNFDLKIVDSVERLASDLRSIQTGRATPMVLDNVMIDAYGSKMLVSHLASVGIEDAKTLRVMPFDKSVLKDLEQGINNANLGLSVASDSDGLRVIFPMLTTERRVQYVKLAKERYEDAKVKIKLSREDSKKDIEAKSKEGAYGEDDKKKFLDTLQNKVDSAHASCEAMLSKKEGEIMGA